MVRAERQRQQCLRIGLDHVARYARARSAVREDLRIVTEIAIEIAVPVSSEEREGLHPGQVVVERRERYAEAVKGRANPGCDLWPKVVTTVHQDELADPV